MTSNVGDSESDEELCANHSTYSYYTPQGVIMGWDGLPVYTHVNDYIDAWIAASMILWKVDSEENKATRVITAGILLKLAKKGSFLDSIVTSDEKWIFYDNRTRKRQWLSTNEDPKPTPKPDIHSKKTLLCVFSCQPDIIIMKKVAVGYLLVQCGFGGLIVNSFCWKVIKSNHHLSKSTIHFLGIDCLCRFYEALTQFYKAYGVLARDAFGWQCVSVIGYPFSGLVVNQIITGTNAALGNAMVLLGSGLSMNRYCNQAMRFLEEPTVVKSVFIQFASFCATSFAIPFGNLPKCRRFISVFVPFMYAKVDRFGLPQAVFLVLFPVVIWLSQIGALVNRRTGFVCYTGWYFTPLNYVVTWHYPNSNYASWTNANFYILIYSTQAITFFIDLMTLWKVRKYTQSHPTKRRSDIRLSIMLFTNHSIAISFYLAKKMLSGSLALTYLCYLFLELTPFLMHCLMGLIVIAFNLPSKGARLGVVTSSRRISRNKCEF